MKLKFLCVGSPAVCKAHSKMQSMSLRLNLVLSEHKIAMLGTGSGTLL